VNVLLPDGRPGGVRFPTRTLAQQHDRAAFSCGVQSLDHYLKTQASQDMRRKANAVFVMVGAEAPTRIVGYFTLCAQYLESRRGSGGGTPAHSALSLVSATLIGRLAVDKNDQGRGVARSGCSRVRCAWRTRTRRLSALP